MHATNRSSLGARAHLLGAWLGLLAAGPTAAAPQQPPATSTGRIEGAILTNRGTIPLRDALLVLTRLDTASTDSIVVRSDGAGRYGFDRVRPGRYRLVISRSGYRSATLHIQVSAGATVIVSRSIEPDGDAPRLAVRDTGTVVTGRVLEARTGTPLSGAVVTVEGTALAARTDGGGRYRIENVPPGPQMLRARLIGYAPSRVAIVVPTEGLVEHDVRMAANPLLLEGVTVTADAIGRARGELATATVIETEAIREQVASSLQGVLELVPGVPVQPPGLDNVQQIALRTAPTSGSNTAFSLVGGSSTDLAAFGTLVVMDGVPVSNNANLQTLGPRAELSFTTSAGGGIDLREIPAATIERVEVIRGVPSARYGDLTQGAIIVDTRAGERRPEVLARYDARTTEVSSSAGWLLGRGDALSGTLDVARSRSNPGVTDDAATRVAAQLAHRLLSGITSDGADRLVLDSRLDAFHFLDDRPATTNTLNRRSWTRNRGLRAGLRGRWWATPDIQLHATASYSRVDQSSIIEAPLTVGAQPITGRLTEGREIGQYLLGTYRAEVNVEGRPRLAYLRLEAETHRTKLGLTHELRTGVELRREWNGGAGIQFDPLRPHQVLFNGVRGYDRPRRFADVRPLVTSAAYIDDRMRRRLGASALLTVQAGVRLDVLHSGGFWTSSDQDLAIQPRINAELAPFAWLRLRAGWGRPAKSPSLALLAPVPEYFDVVNVNWFTNDPAERLAVLTTFVHDPTNPELGYTRAETAELGVEVGVASAAVALVGFRNRVDGGFGFRQVPGFVLRDRYQLTDSTSGTGRPPGIVEPAYTSDTVPVLLQVPENLVAERTRGIELTALLPEIRPIRTRIAFTGSWIQTERTTDALYYGSVARFSEFQLLHNDPRTPYWSGVVEEGTRALATYRVIHHQPALGLVITGIVQHYVKEDIRDVGARDTLAFEGYLTRAGEHVPVPEADRGDPQYRDLRVARGGTLLAPLESAEDWLLSVQVSKTFPLGGRLSFWGFNILDRRGIFPGGGARSRILPPMRFGVELAMPVAALPWLR